MTSVVTVTMVLSWAGGRSPWEVLPFIAAVWAPELTGIVALLAVARTLRLGGTARSAEVMLLMGFAADLRAGATLRSVVAGSAQHPGMGQAAALAQAGRPMPTVLGKAEPALGRHAGVIGSALRVAASTGGSVATVVEQLVAQVMALEALDDERRAATAPVLLQAIIVGGVPCVTLAAMAASGRLVALAAAGPWHAAMVLSGSALVLGGATAVGWLARKSAVL